MKQNNIFKGLILSTLLVSSLPALANVNNGSKFTDDASNIAHKTAGYVKDSSITGYIYAQIALDKHLSAFKTSVTTVNGIVTLAGEVDSDTQASKLIELAASTSGVKSVDAAQLKIKKSDQPVTDVAITAKVKGTLLREQLLGDNSVPNDVSVETKNGVVHLSGKANTDAQIEKAKTMAKEIEGVTSVESDIKKS